jgi:hypothetical protein
MIKEAFTRAKLPTSKYDTYFDAYEAMFSPYRGKDITFVEVGVLGGGSLEAWKSYFGKGSRIIGIDLNPELSDFFKTKGYDLYVGDQADPKFWANFFKKVGKIDVLLDDGGHTNVQQWTTFKETLPFVNDGGVIAIEDVHTAYMMGFGNPSELSFMSRAKACLDEINQRSCRIETRDRAVWKSNPVLEGLQVASYVHSIQFFESVVAFSIDRSRCRTSKEERFGSLSELPAKESPEDYRYKGIEDASMNGTANLPPKKHTKKNIVERALRRLLR